MNNCYVLIVDQLYHSAGTNICYSYHLYPPYVLYMYICIYCIYAHTIFSKFDFFDERPFVSDPAKGSKQVNTSKGVVEDLICGFGGSNFLVDLLWLHLPAKEMSLFLHPKSPSLSHIFGSLCPGFWWHGSIWPLCAWRARARAPRARAHPPSDARRTWASGRWRDDRHSRRTWRWRFKRSSWGWGPRDGISVGACGKFLNFEKGWKMLEAWILVWNLWFASKDLDSGNRNWFHSKLFTLKFFEDATILHILEESVDEHLPEFLEHSQTFTNIHKNLEFSGEVSGEVNFQDGTLKLGINVDHLDGKSGLLLRRVDPEGLVHQHNLQAWRRGKNVVSNGHFTW